MALLGLSTGYRLLFVRVRYLGRCWAVEESYGPDAPWSRRDPIQHFRKTPPISSRGYLERQGKAFISHQLPYHGPAKAHQMADFQLLQETLIGGTPTTPIWRLEAAGNRSWLDLRISRWRARNSHSWECSR